MAGGPADAMTKTFLFDLDMTLVDTSALATLRKTQQWHLVAANMHLVRAFRALPGGVAPHEMPAALSMAGHRVGIVTSSPRPYAEEITRLAGRQDSTEGISLYKKIPLSVKNVYRVGL